MATGLALPVSEPAAAAAPYNYTVIARTGEQFQDLLGSVAINDVGDVAFTAHPGPGGTSLAVGNGGQIHVLANTSRDNLERISSPVLNNAGQAAFLGSRVGQAEAIFRADPFGNTVIVSDSTNATDLTLPSLNNLGQVAYGARLMSGGTHGVFLADGGQPTLLFNEPGMFARSGTPSLNDAGDVLFPWEGADGVTRLLLHREGAASVVAEPDGLFFSLVSPNIALETRPVLNNRDEALFLATLHREHDFIYEEALFVQSPDGLRLIADTSAESDFNGLFYYDLNDRGVVAFTAALTGESLGYGIFTGPDTLRDAVIRSGDRLDGASVFSVGPPQINNLGQIAFVASLSDGRSVMIRADPVPEPATLTLAAIAAASFLLLGPRGHVFHTAQIRQTRRQSCPGGEFL